jgi:ribosomal protein S18 acetylase RimI-like enzyme
MLSYRPATDADVPALCELEKELNRLHHEAAPTVFRAPAEILGAADAWRVLLAKPKEACFVAESDQSVVGYCSVEVFDEAHPLAQPGRYARLGVICVLPAFRRQGVAKSLLNMAEAWSRQHGATDMRLTVWKFNQSAASLYASAGFATRSFTMSKALGSGKD